MPPKKIHIDADVRLHRAAPAKTTRRAPAAKAPVQCISQCFCGPSQENEHQEHKDDDKPNKKPTVIAPDLEQDESVISRMPKEFITPPDAMHGQDDILKYAPQFIALTALALSQDDSKTYRSLCQSTYDGKYVGVPMIETAVALCTQAICGRGAERVSKQMLMDFDAAPGSDALKKVITGTYRCLLVMRDCPLRGLADRIRAVGRVLPLTKNAFFMIGPIVLMHKAIKASR